MLSDGTSLETTHPDATTAFSPIVTPFKIITPAPIQAPLLIVTLSSTYPPPGGSYYDHDRIYKR